MIINQVASGGGGGIDTFDATAYPEHILEGYTAYARGAKITGTLQEGGDEVQELLWSGKLQGTASVSIANMGDYSRLRILVNHYHACSEMFMDITKVPQWPPSFGGAYAAGVVVPLLETSSAMIEFHYCIAEVNEAKNIFYNRQMGWERANSKTVRDANPSYYVYEIWGIIDPT